MILAVFCIGLGLAVAVGTYEGVVCAAIWAQVGLDWLRRSEAHERQHALSPN